MAGSQTLEVLQLLHLEPQVYGRSNPEENFAGETLINRCKLESRLGGYEECSETDDLGLGIKCQPWGDCLCPEVESSGSKNVTNVTFFAHLPQAVSSKEITYLWLSCLHFFNLYPQGLKLLHGPSCYHWLAKWICGQALWKSGQG